MLRFVVLEMGLPYGESLKRHVEIKSQSTLWIVLLFFAILRK